MTAILVIDDEASIGWGISQVAERLGHSADTAASAEQGLDAARRSAPELIFLDVRLPGMDGLSAMSELRDICPDAAIIVMTAFGELTTAVTAVQQGATDYLIKPFNRGVIEKAIQRTMTRPAASRVSHGEPTVTDLVGASPPMQEAFKRIALAAASQAPVLLQGESGTGKELAARAIHKHSDREGPFVAVNLAALSESLAESELFGHVAGAYTGAAENRVGYLMKANRGTLFLDEVADIPLPLQVKLLRAVESGEVAPVGSDRAQTTDLRIIAATHQSLPELIQQGQFRHDLYFRLAAFSVVLPPLRDRGDDILLLAEHFVRQIAKRDQVGLPSLSKDCRRQLQARSWVGNVRELRNALEHAMIVARGGLIDTEHLPDPLPPQLIASSASDEPDEAVQRAVQVWVEQQLQEGVEHDLHALLLKIVEPPLFRTALEVSRGQFVNAAKLLGLHRTTLRKKSDEYGLGE